MASAVMVKDEAHSALVQSLRHQQRQTALQYSAPSLHVTRDNAMAYSGTGHHAPSTHTNKTTHEISRTQHKLMLQRQSFLADDKHYLDHPANMRRLTKELDRVNREYRCVRQFQDPLAESFLRVCHDQAVLQPFAAPSLQRQSSAQACLLAAKEESRRAPSLLNRLLGHSPD